MRFAISKLKFGLCKIECICFCSECPLSCLLYFVCRWPTHPPLTVSMAQAALCDITPRTRIPTLLIVFCVRVLLHVDGCEFRPNWEWPRLWQYASPRSQMKASQCRGCRASSLRSLPSKTCASSHPLWAPSTDASRQEVPSQGRRTMRPRRCSATCGSGRHRRGTAPLWPSSSCPGSASGESVSRRQSAPSTCLRTVECLSTARSRVAPGGGTGGPRGWHRRPLFRFGMAWASYLLEYCKRHDLPTDQPIFSGGEAVLEDYLTTLLHGSRWSGYAWHSLRRGGAASCWNQKPGLPYFKWCILRLPLSHVIPHGAAGTLL